MSILLGFLSFSLFPLMICGQSRCFHYLFRFNLNELLFDVPNKTDSLPIFHDAMIIETSSKIVTKLIIDIQ